MGLAIGGTVAYLNESTGEVENTITPGTVVGVIEENIRNNAKTSITVKNEGTVACYIRVALVANWVNEEGQICTRHEATAITPGKGWTLGADGYYYHTDPVKPGDRTANLLGEALQMTEDQDGCKLQVEVLSSAIQAAGGAVAEAW